MAKKLLKKKLVKKNTPKKEFKFKRLGDVIDKTRNFCMLYSGAEDSKNFNILYDLGIRNYLISYHYASRSLDIDSFMNKDIKFFVDSGAYTYMSNPKYQERTVDEWEEHIKGYLSWARAHKDIIFAIASLDIEYLVGGEKVQEWNEKYFEPFMLETGIPVCFVWHQEWTILTWEQYCQRYPYVGVSWGTETYEDGSGGLKTGQKMLKVAEKHGAVVHGMAMTRTSLLTKLPFYTCDSTTWQVGIQYGEVNYWRGTKMSRLKKEKWKGEMLDQLCSELGRDKQLLLAEDNAELIRINVQAFMKAEEYIKKKGAGNFYWLKPQVVNQSVEDIKFPSIDWIDDPNSSQEDWKDYAKSFNINTELDEPQVAKDLVIDITCFLNWDNPEYENFIEEVYTPELIKQLHTTWINKVVSGIDEQIEDLQHFFRECVEGKNDRLLMLGTNFDRMAREREHYIEEDTEELVDLTEEQFVAEVNKIAPKELTAPEIESLDEEIFADNGLITVRDEKGRFVKGQKKVRKPKNLYSEKYPKLVCNTCYASQNCPEYKEGYVCAYNKMFKRFDCRNTQDILDAMSGMVNMNMERMQRIAIFEMLDGGVADGNLTMMIDQNMRLLMNMQKVQQQQEMVRQVRTISTDGTVTETTQVNNNAHPSILERMFMSKANKSDTKSEEELDKDINNVIEVEPTDIKE